MQRNIRLAIQYDGGDYAGWQYQKNAWSVQEAIEGALRKIIGEKVSLIGAGRTDSGVHAKGQTANFKTSSKIPLKNIRNALNSLLPKDIVIKDISQADPRFNARHDAKSKLYRYTLVPAPFVDPFIRKFAVRCKYRLDIDAMRRSARCLIGRHDFRAFQANGANESDTVRTIKKIRIVKDKSLLCIDIEADAFLYNMARSIVGTLIEVGRGKSEEDITRKILSKKERRLSGPTAPAKGLCLMKVRY